MTSFLVISAHRARDLVFGGEFTSQTDASQAAKDAVASGISSAYVVGVVESFSESTLQEAGTQVDRGVVAAEDANHGVTLNPGNVEPEAEVQASAPTTGKGTTSTSKTDD